MSEVAGLVGNLIKDKNLRPPEQVVLMSQRELKQLPLVHVTAVDPENAHEIDDAFFITKKSGHPHNVSIVIANGASISYLTEEFQQALKNGWSIYPETGKYVPMIDDSELVIDELSLGGKGLKPGLEISFQLLANGVTRRHQLRKEATRTHRKTYGQYGRELVAGQHPEVLSAVNSIRRYRGIKNEINPRVYVKNQFNGYFSPKESLARKRVEELMVQANKEVGRFVRQKGFAYPYRFTDFVPADEVLDRGVESIIEDLKVEELKIMRAFYSPNPRLHQDLNTRHYTHTTSPLRRCMDLLGHNIIDFMIKGGRPKDIDKKSIEKATNHINSLISERAVRIGREF